MNAGVRMGEEAMEEVTLTTESADSEVCQKLHLENLAEPYL